MEKQFENVKRYTSAVLIVCVLAIILCACNGGKVSIGFDANGGTHVATRTISRGDRVGDLPVPTRDGYVFAGWYSDAALSCPVDADTSFDADATLYADWGHYVVFDAGEGSAVPSQLVRDGSTCAIPTAPVHDSLGFAGWYLDADYTTKYDFSTPVTCDLTLKARYLVMVDTISTAQDLLAMGNDPTRDYTLSNDIDLEGMEIDSFFATDDVRFTGSFDGGGYAISNFVLRSVSGTLGLFGINEGTINALTLKDVKVSSSSSGNAIYGGVLCGLNKGTISDCNVSAVVNGNYSDKQNYFGVLAGNNIAGGIVQGCRVQASLGIETSAATGYFGGAVGYNSGMITATEANIDITFSALEGSQYVGGFVGYSANKLSAVSAEGKLVAGIKGVAFVGGLNGVCAGGNMTISASYADVDIDLNLSRGAIVTCGGLTAAVSGKVENCFASGDVSSVGSSDDSDVLTVGGLAANVYKNAEVKNSFALGDLRCTAGTLYSGGAVYENKGNCSSVYRYSNQNVYSLSGTVGNKVGKEQLSDADWYTTTLGVSAESFPLSQAVAAATRLTDASSSAFPKVIGSAAEFLAIPNNTVDYYQLAGDIDLGGADVTPINFNSDSSGFDGNGHRISGFVLREDNGYVGLFGVNSGTIRDLIIADFSLDDTFGNVTCGVLCAVNKSTIKDCSILSGNATLTGGGLTVGGVVGVNSGTLDGVVCSATISARSTSSGGYAYLGGVVGRNDGEVLCCAFLGALTSNECCGGIAAISDGHIYQSLNRGSVTIYSDIGRTVCAGGLIARCETKSELTNCYNAGNVTVVSEAGDVNAGGLIGQVRGTVRYCYSVGTISATAMADVPVYVGGLVGLDKGANVSYGYFGGVVSSVCDVDAAKAYGGMIAARSSGTIENVYFDAKATLSAQTIYEAPKQVKIDATFNYEYAAANLKFSKEKWYKDTAENSLPRLLWEFE